MAIWRSICVWSSSGRHFLIYSKHIPCRWILWYVGRTTTRHRRVNHQGRHIPSLSPFDATVRQRWGSGEPLSLFLFSPFVSTTKVILSFVSLHLCVHTKLNLKCFLFNMQLLRRAWFWLSTFTQCFLLPVPLSVCEEVKEVLLHRVEPGGLSHTLGPDGPSQWHTAWLHASNTDSVAINIIEKFSSSFSPSSIAMCVRHRPLASEDLVDGQEAGLWLSLQPAQVDSNVQQVRYCAGQT